MNINNMKKNLFLTAIIVFLITVIGTFIFIPTPRPIKIIFIGDSLTFFGRLHETGFVSLFDNELNKRNINAKIQSEGTCGETTNNMLYRIDEDVFAKKPDIVFFLGGNNDIGLYYKESETFEKFKKNIEELTDKSHKENVSLYIISLSLYNEILNSDGNKIVDEFNEFLKQHAKKEHVGFIDTNTPLKKEVIKNNGKMFTVTRDGIHMNELGDKIVAEQITKVFFKDYLFIKPKLFFKPESDK